MRATPRSVAAIALGLVALVMPLVASGSFGSALDNEIPGVPLPKSPVVERLDATNAVLTSRDVSDVYQVPLRQGQWFYASMTGESGTDYDLHLFGPEATRVSGRLGGVAYAERARTSSERLLHRATQDGTYYLAVQGFGGAGAYKISYGNPSVTATMTASAPPTTTWGGSAKVTGVVESHGVPVTNLTVRLFEKPSGSKTWKAVAKTSTSSTGTYSFTVKPKRRTAYQVRHLGNTRYLPSKTPTVKVIPYAYLTVPSAPTTVKAGVAFTSKGYLKPRHTAGAKSVKIQCFRRELQADGSYRYVLRKTYSAVNANYKSYTRYSAKVKLPTAGKWRIVATIAGDSVHAATTSKPRTRTVP